MSGNSYHWLLSGVSSLYLETPLGFRVYVNNTAGFGITTQDVLDFSWWINWMAIEQ